MAYITVAYYTENTSYAEEIKNLETSLLLFKLPRDLVAIPSQGSWQKNTHYKPYFIKQMLIRHFPKDILYLDADARVLQYPALFSQVDFDLGVFYWELPQRPPELLTGTLYFANNSKTYELIDRWINNCFHYPDVWEQKILQLVINHSEDLGLHIHHLPATYCQIYDSMSYVKDPVIVHFQASRRLKSEVDKKID